MFQFPATVIDGEITPPNHFICAQVDFLVWIEFPDPMTVYPNFSFNKRKTRFTPTFIKRRNVHTEPNLARLFGQ